MVPINKNLKLLGGSSKVIGVGGGMRGGELTCLCYYSATKCYTYGHFLTQWNLSLRYIISSKLLVWPYFNATRIVFQVQGEIT